MMRSYKCFPHVSEIPILTYKGNNEFQYESMLVVLKLMSNTFSYFAHIGQSIIFNELQIWHVIQTHFYHILNFLHDRIHNIFQILQSVVYNENLITVGLLLSIILRAITFVQYVV